MLRHKTTKRTTKLEEPIYGKRTLHSLHGKAQVEEGAKSRKFPKTSNLGTMQTLTLTLIQVLLVTRVSSHKSQYKIYNKRTNNLFAIDNNNDNN